MRGMALYPVFVLLLVLGFFAFPLQAALVYQLEIFTDNGLYFSSSELELFVEVSQGTEDYLIDFTFHNQSQIESSIAGIYFDSALPLDFVEITQGLGTVFERFATPENLPAGKDLKPAFLAIADLSFDSDPAVPHNGINPGQWLTIGLTVADGSTFEDVIDSLNGGSVRIGTHVIALPDGSSESAVNIPEPLTFFLIAIGAAVLLKKRKN